MTKINCRECKHYFITFDVSAPYGCRIFGFKGKVMPSILVYQSSGIMCSAFLPKQHIKKEIKTNNNAIYA